VPGFRLLLTVVAPKGSWQTGCHFQPLRIRTPKRSGGSDAELFPFCSRMVHRLRDTHSTFPIPSSSGSTAIATSRS
jgi:hypothetical protein